MDFGLAVYFIRDFIRILSNMQDKRILAATENSAMTCPGIFSVNWGRWYFCYYLAILSLNSSYLSTNFLPRSKHRATLTLLISSARAISEAL